MAESASTQDKQVKGRTAGEAGWHVSRYNLSAQIPDSKYVAIANLYKGNCAEYTPIELYLLSVLEDLDENHPIIERFAKRGVIANFDERAAIESLGRAACAHSGAVNLTICPTIGCNFDCPYCFENHRAGKMSQEVQDDIVTLAERMLDASGAKFFSVTWFGGEPLLAPDVIDALSKRFLAIVEERKLEYNAGIITNGYLLTQDIVDMLDRNKVEHCQITIDGLGATHDATRHLAGGGGTFDRIVENLRSCKIPFKINIRHNVHERNRGEIDELEAFVTKLAEESGNALKYYPAPVSANETADERGKQVDVLCSTNASDVGIRQEAHRFSVGRGHYCGAHILWSIGIDDHGRLYKCWESVDKPEEAYGTARDWDPMNPIATAATPDRLTRWLNTSSPIPDEECRECVWLPMCVGGCPNKRLSTGRECVAFRNNPEAYVLALHARIAEEKEAEKAE